MGLEAWVLHVLDTVPYDTWLRANLSVFCVGVLLALWLDHRERNSKEKKLDEAKFKAAYNESRNGANYFIRHPLSLGGRFEYSDGVGELAEAGCYWLLDVIATECLVPLRKSGYPSGLVEVTVSGGKADIALTVLDDTPPIWSKHVPWTDMPEGRWVFELGDEGVRFALILITEH